MGNRVFEQFDISKIVNCYRLSMKPNKLINAAPRSRHAFCFFLSGESEYIYGDTVIRTDKNSLLYLPQGKPYVIKRHNAIECIVIDFLTFQTDPQPVYSRNFKDGNKEIENLFETALTRYCENISEASVKSVLYSLIAKCQKLELMRYAPSSDAALIHPALEYLRLHFTEESVNTRLLANLCNVGEHCFTDRFLRHTGLTPKQYVIQLRLHHARNLLKTSDYTVSDIAENSGFKNVYYFSRLFKEKTGMTPKKYRETAD